MREKVQAAIDKIRPALQKDGGDVILVDVSDDGIVKVQLTGACKGCPMSQMTLKEGIEKFVKSEIPEIVSVESVSINLRRSTPITLLRTASKAQFYCAFSICDIFLLP